MSYRRIALSTLLVAGLAACSAAPTPPSSSVIASTPSSTAAVSAPPAAPALASVPAPEAAPLPRPKTPFVFVVDAAPQIEPAMNGGIFLHTNNGFGILRGDRIEFDPTWMKGLSNELGPWSYIVWMGGRFPDASFAAVTRTDGRSGWTDVFRRSEASWGEMRAGRNNSAAHPWIYLGIRPFSEGRILAALRSGFALGDLKFEVLSGKPARILPEPSRDEEGRVLVAPEAFTSLETGHVFVFGTMGTAYRRIERWEPGQKKGVVYELSKDLPGDWDNLTMKHVLALSPTEVYVLSCKRYDSQTIPAYLLRFDGASWTPEELPTRESGVSISAEPDGTLWVGTTNEVLRKKPGGSWEQVPVPSRGEGRRFEVHQVFAMGKDDIWLSSNEGLFTTRANKPAGTLELKDTLEGRPSLRLPRAATPECEHVFALLYTLAKTAPPDYDFPLTREAFKGHSELEGARFVETEENGRRYFGAFVPSYELGKKLVGVVANKVKGSTPQLLCHEPRVLREIKLDLATGKILP